MSPFRKTHDSKLITHNCLSINSERFFLRVDLKRLRPNGMEYKEFYVAQSTVLKGTGPVKFDYRDRHSSLADVDHTDKGLQA